VNANNPFGLYTSLVFSSYVSYRLNSSSNLTFFTAPFWAQKAFGEVRERHVSDPSFATTPVTEVGGGGREHVVKVIGGGAEFDVDRGGKILLRIRFTAEVDGVRRDYEITYGRYEKNEGRGFAYFCANVPGGRSADAERFSAVVKALTGREPKVCQKSGGKINGV
jgi:hypothetical protein